MGHDNLCGRCENGLHGEYFPNPVTTHKFYTQGEVVRIKESVDSVVQHGIITQTAIVLDYPGFTFRNRPEAYKDYRRRPALLAKTRQVTGPNDDALPSSIVLFATFDSCAPLHADLPKVLQWFSIPVAPHSAVQTGTEHTHIHTSPEWSHSGEPGPRSIDAWLIAREYTSRGLVDCRWRKWNGTRPNSSFKVDSDILEDIKEAVHDLWSTWLDECRVGRSVLEEYQKDYLEFITTLEKRQEAIRHREAEKVRGDGMVPVKEAVKQEVARPRPGMSTTPLRASPIKPSVTAGRSQSKVAGDAQTASAVITKSDSAVAQNPPVPRLSAMERLRALFAPSKTPVNKTTPGTKTVVLRSSQDNVNVSSDTPKQSKKGERIAVPA
ncbi:hypothetical protein V8D89_008437 [Ganoderma adspersum]